MRDLIKGTYHEGLSIKLCYEGPTALFRSSQSWGKLLRIGKTPNNRVQSSSALQCEARARTFDAARLRITELRKSETRLYCAGALFQDVLTVALRVPQTLPRNKVLRKRFIAYLHRMVECLETDILPFLPQALAALLHSQCDASDMVDAMRLVNQLLAAFPSDVDDHLRTLLPALVARCGALRTPLHRVLLPALHRLQSTPPLCSGATCNRRCSACRVLAMLPRDWDWTGAVAAAQVGTQGGNTEEVRENAELQLAFHSLLSAIGATNFLSTLEQSPVLSQIMEASVRVRAQQAACSRRATAARFAAAPATGK